MSECKYIIIQVEEIVGRELNKQEVDAVSEMYKLGCTTRQMACKVKQLAAIEFGNQRRVVHLKKLKKLGTTLNGKEMHKFKMQVDKKAGLVESWESLGYPAAYRSDAVVKVENQPKTKKIKKSKKAAPKSKPKEKVKKTKTKSKKPIKPIRTCIDLLNSMDVVD